MKTLAAALSPLNERNRFRDAFLRTADPTPPQLRPPVIGSNLTSAHHFSALLPLTSPSSPWSMAAHGDADVAAADSYRHMFMSAAQTNRRNLLASSKDKKTYAQIEEESVQMVPLMAGAVSDDE